MKDEKLTIIRANFEKPELAEKPEINYMVYNKKEYPKYFGEPLIKKNKIFDIIKKEWINIWGISNSYHFDIREDQFNFFEKLGYIKNIKE